LRENYYHYSYKGLNKSEPSYTGTTSLSAQESTLRGRPLLAPRGILLIIVLKIDSDLSPHTQKQPGLYSVRDSFHPERQARVIIIQLLYEASVVA